jgi:protein-tyrosine sulfotransferase
MPENAGDVTSFADPVFVLCNGRSGSTLLRFMLDAHPDLACPPETNLPGLCVQLATVWSLIEGAPLSANRGDEPPEIPDPAIAGVRETMDRMVGSYLGRRGKKRYCDKSLGTAQYAELLLRVYPQARFICVYRHPMDVIASGIEACPWGLNGYGFDPYVAAAPGNTVMALASFWADNSRATLAVEERFAHQCFRLRYEDLVADPETVMAALFQFLDIAPVPGISRACFSAERERFGPADYKIWFTSQVNADSVGRGWSVPAGMIAPQMLTHINETAGKLWYLLIDGDWGTTEPPADLRVAVTPSDGTPAVKAGSLRAVYSGRLGNQLRNGLAALRDDKRPDHWPAHAAETFVAVAVTKDSAHPAEYWLVDLGAGTVTLAAQETQESSGWDMIASVDTWEKIISGDVNLSVAMRSCQLRYCDNGETTPLLADTRIAILGQLLGLASWTLAAS